MAIFGHVIAYFPAGRSPHRLFLSPNIATGAKYIAIGNNTLLQSEQGIAWEDLAPPASDNWVGGAAIDLAVTRGCIVLCSLTKVYEMDINGVWTDVTPADYTTGGVGDVIYGMAYLPGAGFIISGNKASATKAWLSNDGVTWISADPLFLGNSIYAGGGVFIRFHGTEELGTTFDKVSVSGDGGFNWTIYNAHTFVNITTKAPYHYAVAHPNGGDANLWKSSDLGASSWTGNLYTFTGFFAGQIIYTGAMEKFLIFTRTSGDSPVILYSSDDGVTWDSESQPNPVGGTLATAGFSAIIAQKGILSKGSNNTNTPYILLTIDGTTNVEDDLFGGSSDIDDPEYAYELSSTWNGTNGTIELEAVVNNPVGQKVNGMLITAVAGSNNGSGSITGMPFGTEIIIGSVPINGNGTYAFTHTFVGSGFTGSNTPKFTYRFYLYSAELDSISSLSSSSSFVGGVPDLEVTGSGGISFGGSSSIVTIGEPSGIYTLVKDKTHDTLYERQSGTTTSINVKIPDPYIKTGFVSGSN